MMICYCSKKVYAGFYHAAIFTYFEINAYRGIPTINCQSIHCRAMLQEFIIVISAIAGLVAAAGGFWAARAAQQSAVTAQEASRHAETVDRRGLVRDLNATAHRIAAESLQIGSLIEELKAEYRMFATSSGQLGSSREKLLIQQAEAKQKDVYPLQEEAQKLIEVRANLVNVSEEDLTQSLSKLDGYLVQVLRIKDNLEREVAAAAGDNRIDRERRVKAFHKHRLG
jgi:hypothetical protein